MKKNLDIFIVLMIFIWSMTVAFKVIIMENKIKDLETKVEWLEAQNDNVIEVLISDGK